MKPRLLTLSAIMLFALAGSGQTASKQANASVAAHKRRSQRARGSSSSAPSPPQASPSWQSVAPAVSATTVASRVDPVVATPSLRSRSRACRASFDLG